MDILAKQATRMQNTKLQNIIWSQYEQDKESHPDGYITINYWNNAPKLNFELDGKEVAKKFAINRPGVAGSLEIFVSPSKQITIKHDPLFPELQQWQFVSF